MEKNRERKVELVEIVADRVQSYFKGTKMLKLLTLRNAYGKQRGEKE